MIKSVFPFDMNLGGDYEKIYVNSIFYGNKNYILHNFAGIG